MIFINNMSLTKAKAKEILRDGKVRGKSLSKRQRKFLGFVAGGGKPTQVK